MATYLGISAFYHDSAACIVRDSRILAACQEERFSRVKHDASFPRRAIEACLEIAGIEAREIDNVVFYEKPFLKFERLLETYIGFAPSGFSQFQKSMPLWIKDKIFQKAELVREMSHLDPEIDWQERLLFSEHHLSHAASAFFPSPFSDAAVLTMDGVGEWATTSIAVGRGIELDILKEIHFPHSLGLMYTAFTDFLGFKVNSGEYKVMGLAPYGVPRFTNRILEEMVDVKPDGSFRLNLDFFGFCTGLRMTTPRFAEFFGTKPRNQGGDLTRIYLDIAASVQRALEEIVLRLVRNVLAETRLDRLCLSGGVALNCVTNGRIERETSVKSIWVQPASGDAGGALGAALVAAVSSGKFRRDHVAAGVDAMRGSLLGPDFRTDEISRAIQDYGAISEWFGEDALLNQVSRMLVAGKCIGWFQGAMEYGPRALGNRSILANPMIESVQGDLNLKIKFRESFRPFAPAVLAEDAAGWFDLKHASPYMLKTAPVIETRRTPIEVSPQTQDIMSQLGQKRSDIPAVTHVDFSARVQTADHDTNPLFHSLLKRFKARTGCPILVNTSFNVRGEPIVCTPFDALHCFFGTGLDALVIGNHVLLKAEQPKRLLQFYSEELAPD